jgi:hypothetical protein
LFMSGYTEGALPNNLESSGRTGYLEKPFTVESLMRRLREILDA